MFKQVTKEELQVPADIDYLSQLRDFVIKIGHKYNFSVRVINAFKLSIDEAATNIIRHAYRDHKGNITIRAIIKKNSLTIVLVDQGKFFDPRIVKDPDLKRYVDIGKKGGLGIFMMRKLIDEIDYRKTEEGNELRLTKMRDGAALRKSIIPSIPMTLRVKYSFYACLVFSLVVAIIYFIYFYQWSNRISQRWHTTGIDRVKYLSSNVTPNLSRIIVSEGGTFFESQIAAGSAIKSLIDTDERNIIYQVFILDSTDIILHAQRGKEILETAVKYVIPKQNKLIAPGIRQFKAGDKVVYDYSEPIYDEESQRRIGTSHVWIDNAAPRAEIRRNRFDNLQVALLILAIGNAGIFFFTTIVLNPFRHLTDWIRDLGHTEVQDEMDIDDSSEVGEIAKAFSDMTQQLRASQANLAEQERFQKEMQVAQEIQQTLLPSEFPQIEGYELASYYLAAKQVGGDYYDFVEVDKDTLGIVVADVSGKGVPGSLVMTMIRTALRTEARGIKDASEVLARVNQMVVNDMKKGMFVTVFYMILDSKHRRISYASAGHNPMILYRAGRNKTYYLNPKGFPLGISLPDKDQFRNTIESDTLQLAEDDIIIIYTDGVTEAMNSKRFLYGEERFLNVIRNHGHLGAEAFVNMLKDEVKSFTEDSPQNDDITLVAIKEKFSSEKLQLQRAQKAYRLITENNVPVKEACIQADISVYMFNKYKKQFEMDGVDSVVIEVTEVESKHLSIEEKTKIYDIILKHPEYGAKRISEELKTEVYGFEEIKENKIYDELVRSRLNTRELREAFVQRGGKKRRRIKQPGTPLLTMDGKVIIQKGGYEEEPLPTPEVVRPVKETKPKIVEAPKIAASEPPTPGVPQKEAGRAAEKKKVVKKPPAPVSIRDFSGVILNQPIEDILDKNSGRQPKAPAQEPDSTEASPKKPELSPKVQVNAHEPQEKVPDAMLEHDLEEELLAAENAGEELYQETVTELDVDFEPSYSDNSIDSLFDTEPELTESEPEKIYTEPELEIETGTGLAAASAETPPVPDWVSPSEAGIEPAPPLSVEDTLLTEAIATLDVESQDQDLYIASDAPASIEPVPPAKPAEPVATPTEDELVSVLIADLQNRTAEPDYYEASDATEPELPEAQKAPETVPVPVTFEAAPSQVVEEKSDETTATQDTDLLDTLLAEVNLFDSIRSAGGSLQDSQPVQLPDATEQGLPIENEFFEGIQWLEEATSSEIQPDDGKLQVTRADSIPDQKADSEPSDNDLFIFDEDLSLVKELAVAPNKDSYVSDLDELELMELISQKAGMDDPLSSPKNDRSSRKKNPDFEQIQDETENEYESLGIDEKLLYDYDALEDVDSLNPKAAQPPNDAEANFDRLQQMFSESESVRWTRESGDTSTGVLHWRIVETRPALAPENRAEKNVKIDMSATLAEGLRYYEDRNFNAAINKFGQIIQLQPDSIGARTMLGHCYFHKKMYRHAEFEYNQITRLDPSDLDARDNLAVVYALQGHYEKAVQIWESILNCDPERKSIQKNIEKAQQMMI